MAIRTDVGLSLYDAFNPSDISTWVGTPLIIRETSGFFRTLTLSGRALPFAGVTLPMRRRGRTTWYQGTATATQHVMGVEYGETTIEGRWVSQHLTEDLTAALFGIGALLIPVTSAEQLREYVYDLVKGGQELEWSWAGIRRTSSLCEFEPEIVSRGEVRWRWSFEWSGDGIFIPLPIVDSLASAALSVFDAISQILDWAKYPANILLDITDFVDDQIARVGGLINDVRDTIGLYTSGVASILEVAGRAAGLLDTIRRQAKAVRDDLAGFDGSSAYTGSVIDPAASIVQARIDAWLRNTRRSAERVASTAGRAANVYRKVDRPDVEGILTIQGDTDLRMVAQQRWGNPDGWRVIAKFNGVQGSQVSAGDVILIPARQAA